MKFRWVILLVTLLSLTASTLGQDAKLAEIIKLAKSGDAEAQFNLGAEFDLGRAVPKDDKWAVIWYRKAADQGFARAQYHLGQKYELGRGVPEDDKEAVKWYRKAADQGVVVAQFSLGVMYAFGQGVPQDDVMAYKWYNIAAASGFNDAIKYKGIITKRMTREQIAEAQKLSREWKPIKDR